MSSAQRRNRARRLGRSDVRGMLEASGTRPSKQRGQNFLVDPNVAERICRLADVCPGDQILEVGVGLGSLTVAMVGAGARVLGIEVDSALAGQTRAMLADDDAEILVADATRLDWEEILSPSVTKMVSNLPYSVGTHVLVDLLDTAEQIDTFVVMVQREVADRLLAGPGDPEFGGVSLRVAYHTDARSGGTVGRGVFYPEPEVESALVVLRRHAPAVSANRDVLFDVIDAGFAQRRKTIRNALGSRLGFEAADAALGRAGIDPTRRAETMSLDEFGSIADVVAVVD